MKKPKKKKVICDCPCKSGRCMDCIIEDWNKYMQINFKTEQEKQDAILAQTELNATEVISAQAVFDKRVARGVALLNDIRNATVGAIVPASSILVSDATEIVNRIVTDTTQASQVVAEITAKGSK